MPSTILQTSCIRKQVDGRDILSAIDWRIRDGEHWALLGANGAGKTTLLRLILGYDWPSEGSVRVMGELYGRTELHALRRRIGWVASALEHRFHGEDNALEIAASGIDASIGLYREFGDREFERAWEALAAIGAEATAGQPYRTLSQGERQRVMIARALVNRPALLVLDEPCAGLDPAAREHFLRDLTRFARRRAAPTLIYCTHHLEEIPPPITHALILKAGRILTAGKIERTLTDEALSEAFACRCRVDRRKGRYFLEVLE